jgi:hypothetical protein
LLSRAGSSRSPSRTDRRTPPRISGTPTSANSKQPKFRPSASNSASEIRTCTGVPASNSIEPQCAPKTSGISNRPGDRPRRTARTTTTGRSAATAPFTLMSALSTATASVIKTMSRVRLSPDLSIRAWPTQAVTPERSIPAPITKSDATKIVAGSPNPARLCPMVRIPVAQSASAQPRQTAKTGSRSQMKTIHISDTGMGEFEADPDKA